jgi:ubiquinone/menaquinone biosynthesis C-methylase UbiE
MTKKNKDYDYNSIDEGYYDRVLNSSGAQSKWHELKFEKIYRRINEEKPKELLDVACGPGSFISKLPSEINCHGIDIAQKQIHFANKKYGNKRIKFLKCKDAQFPFDDNSFDIITSVEFIEHVSEESCKKNLLEMSRCLKNNGKLILTTPNYRSLWPLLEFIVSLVTKENYLEQHITHYNRKSLEKMMLDSGFVNVKVETYLFLSPFFAYLSNDMSNWLFNLENKYIKRWGNLLIAQGEVVGD